MDKRRHAAALAVAAIREETLAVGEGAKATTINGSHAHGTELASGERTEIGLPAAAVVSEEARFGARIGRDESFPDLAADLERGL